MNEIDNAKTEKPVRKAPVWDLVGLILTRDKRLLYIVPAVVLFCWAANRFF